MKFINNLLLEVLIANNLSDPPLPDLILYYCLLLILLILWIFHAIMSEIESFSRLYDLPEPFGKVRVVDLLGLPRVFHFDKHLENIEIESRTTSNQLSKVLYTDEPVVI